VNVLRFGGIDTGFKADLEICRTDDAYLLVGKFMNFIS